MKELEAEADKLRRAISGTTDPYLQKQLSEKLTKVE
jgi:hypothetical protein